MGRDTLEFKALVAEQHIICGCDGHGLSILFDDLSKMIKLELFVLRLTST